MTVTAIAPNLNSAVAAAKIPMKGKNIAVLLWILKIPEKKTQSAPDHNDQGRFEGRGTYIFIDP
jgi:hypothetical protein